MERTARLGSSLRGPRIWALLVAAPMTVAGVGCDRGAEDRTTAPPASGPQAPTRDQRPASADSGGSPAIRPNTPPTAISSTVPPTSIDPNRPALFAAVPRPPAKGSPFDAADPRIAIAQSMLVGGRLADAQRALEVVLRDKPGVAQAEMLLAVALQKQKRYGDAKPHFERAIALRQSFPEVDHLFHFLGWCEYYLSDMTASRRAFEEHLRRVPDEPDSTFGLAMVAMEEDRIDEAERLLLRSIASLKDNPSARRDISKARIRLADVYTRLDRPTDAERELRDALKLYPDHAEAWAKLARLLDRADRPVEAERARAEERAAMRRAGRAPMDAPNQPPATEPET